MESKTNVSGNKLRPLEIRLGPFASGHRLYERSMNLSNACSRASDRARAGGRRSDLFFKLTFLPAEETSTDEQTGREVER